MRLWCACLAKQWQRRGTDSRQYYPHAFVYPAKQTAYCTYHTLKHACLVVSKSRAGHKWNGAAPCVSRRPSFLNRMTAMVLPKLCAMLTTIVKVMNDGNNQWRQQKYPSAGSKAGDKCGLRKCKGTVNKRLVCGGETHVPDKVRGWMFRVRTFPHTEGFDFRPGVADFLSLCWPHWPGIMIFGHDVI